MLRAILSSPLNILLAVAPVCWFLAATSIVVVSWVFPVSEVAPAVMSEPRLTVAPAFRSGHGRPPIVWP